MSTYFTKLLTSLCCLLSILGVLEVSAHAQAAGLTDPTLPLETLASAPSSIFVLSAAGAIDVYDPSTKSTIRQFYNATALHGTGNQDGYRGNPGAAPTVSTSLSNAALVGLQNAAAAALNTTPQAYFGGALALSEDKVVAPYLFVLQLGLFVVDVSGLGVGKPSPPPYLPLTFDGACANASSIAVNNVDSLNVHQLFVVNPYVDVNGSCATSSTSVGGNVVVYDITNLRTIAAAAGSGLAHVTGTVLTGPKQPFGAASGAYGVYVTDLDSSGSCNFLPASVGCGKLWFFPPSTNPSTESARAQVTNTGANPTGLTVVGRPGSGDPTNPMFQCSSSTGDSILVFGSGAFGVANPTTSLTMAAANGASICSVLVPQTTPSPTVSSPSQSLSVAPSLASIGAFSPDGDLGRVGGQVLFADGSVVSAPGGIALGNGNFEAPPANNVDPFVQAPFRLGSVFYTGGCCSLVDLPVDTRKIIGGTDVAYIGQGNNGASATGYILTADGTPSTSLNCAANGQGCDFATTIVGQPGVLMQDLGLEEELQVRVALTQQPQTEQQFYQFQPNFSMESPTVFATRTNDSAPLVQPVPTNPMPLLANTYDSANIGVTSHYAVSVAVAKRPICQLGGVSTSNSGASYNLPLEAFSALPYYQFGTMIVSAGQCHGNLLHTSVSADVGIYTAANPTPPAGPGFPTAGGVGSTVALLDLTQPGFMDVGLSGTPALSIPALKHAGVTSKATPSSPAASNSCAAACSAAIAQANLPTGCPTGSIPACACIESMNSDPGSITSIFQPICAGSPSVAISGLPLSVQASPTAHTQPVQLTAALQSVNPTPTPALTPGSFTWSATNVSGPPLDPKALINPNTGVFTPPGTLSTNPAVNPRLNQPIVQVQASWNGAGFDPRATAAIKQAFGVTPTFPITSGQTFPVAITGSWFDPLSPISFTPTIVYGQSQQAVPITNAGNAALNFTTPTSVSCGATTSCPFAVDPSTSCGSGAPVLPGQTCTIKINFSPTTSTPPDATLTLLTDSANALTQQPLGTGGAGVSIPIQGTVSNASAAVSPSGIEVHRSTSAYFYVTSTIFVPQQSPGSVTWSVNGAKGGNQQVGTIVAIAPTGTNQVTAATYTAPAAGNPPITISASLSNPAVIIQSTAVVIAPDVTVSISPSVQQDLQAGSTAPQTLIATVGGGYNGDLRTVTWSVSGNCGGKACGTYTPSGNLLTYTAPPATSLFKPVVDTIQAASVDQTSIVSLPVSVEYYLAPQINAASGNQITQSVTAGQTATYNLLLVANTGDPLKTMTVTCDSTKLPTGVTCSSAQIVPGSNNVPFSIALTTTGVGTASTRDLTQNREPFSLGLILPLAGLISFFRKRRLERRRTLRAYLLTTIGACLVLILTGCGVSGSYGTNAPKGIGATPLGMFTIPIGQLGSSPSTFQPIASAQLIVQ